MRARFMIVLAVCAVAAAVALAWRFTPLSTIVRPDRIAAWLDNFEGSPWSPVIVISVYVIGGFVMLPVTMLSAATAMVFHPLIAAPISFTGAMLSAATLYGVGARLLRGRARKAFGPTIDRLDRALVGRGVVAVAAVRTVPLAPFTLVNMAAGSLGVRFRDYLLGTAIGLAPGVIVTSIFGRQVRSLWQHPTSARVLGIAGIILAWIVLSLVLQRWITRRAHASRS